MAVSIIRQLKEVDVVDPDSETRRSWLIFDPLAADAQSPGRDEHLLSIVHGSRCA